MDTPSNSIQDSDIVADSFGRKIIKLSQNAYLRFVLKKFVFYLIVLFCALSLVWYIPRLDPTDPLLYLFNSGTSGSWVQARQKELESFYGLDKPLFDQFLTYWWNLLHFDLGIQYDPVGSTVISAILPSFILTMLLVVPVLFIGFFLGNYIGGKAALNKGLGSKLSYYFVVFFQSAPYYWTALGAIIVFFWINDTQGINLNSTQWAFLTDFNYDLAHPLDFLHMYLIPFIIMLLFSTGGWSTGMRSMMLYELDSPYLLYSKQLGFKKSLLESYARRNAILPQITGLNLRFNELVGATLIVEYVFNYKGIGTLIVRSAQTHNYPMIIGSFVIIILATVIGNFLLDIFYGLIDPRIRTGKAS